jgi:DNA polymerase
MSSRPFLENCFRWLDETLGVGADPFHLVSSPVRTAPKAPRPAPEPVVAPAPAPPALPAAAPNGSGLEALRQRVKNCQACGLAARRKNFVNFGNPAPFSLMFLTDYPEFYDEKQGRHFAAESGALLDKMLAALGVSRATVWLSAVIKCHTTVAPGSDLKPYLVCREHLAAEVLLAQPRMVVGFGELSYRFIFERDDFAQIRGTDLLWNGVPMRFTHHPRDLEFDPALKREAWDDLKTLKVQ